MVIATRPEPTTLTGAHIVLEPLAERHLPGLWPVLGHKAVFAGGYGKGPAGLQRSEADFVEWARAYYATSDNSLPFVVLVRGGAHDGRIIGASALGDLDEVNANVQIGWTAYDPQVWGTAVNPEAKLLLLTHAFDHGYNRVTFHADAINDRSRAAILKLGATFEGIKRKHGIRADGSWRDTALYSVLDTEWPAVQAGLRARLETAAAPFAAEPATKNPAQPRPEPRA